MSAFADRSDEIDLLASALVDASAELRDVPKTRTADTGKYGYKFADLADALDIARPVLARHGLAVTQAAEVADGEAVVWTTLLHRSGQFVTAAPTRLPAGPTAQSTGSAITYGRRYSLLAVLGLAAEDDDGASAGVRTAPPPARTTGAKARRDATPNVRTSAEAQIRAIVAAIPQPIVAVFRGRFEEEFGCRLTDLPEERHDEALRWVRQHAPVEVADEAGQ